MDVESGVDWAETSQTQLELGQNSPSGLSLSASATPVPRLTRQDANRTHAANMDLAIPGDDYPGTRLRAIQDAIGMQDLAVKQCSDAGIEMPPYKLTELIGKGSFGRVYKATATGLGKTVAVKIMSIEEGDCLAPGQSDTFTEILKEVTTLRILNDGGAKNINRIIDSILVGHSMWMVTDYCAGGSVATLMRPTGFLPETWIVPIVREVAEAIYWVHRQGIIHRDLKCANVLITEDGGVQLCDFGVAGIMRTKFDKRSTITGTLQWMAPELFDGKVAYGKEVDIWAFGSMAYEAATGFPPNATTLLDMDLNRFGAYLRESCPRLEGDQYSDQLKDMISYCMVSNPAKRPRIEDVQQHPYIHNSSGNFPTSSLRDLVKSYKEWEKKGGNRQSLFMPGGAQCHARNRSGSAGGEGWDYGTMDEADQVIFEHDPVGAVKTPPKPRPPLTRGQRHRRRNPPDVPAVKPPLARAFDPNTLSNYQDQVKAFYQRSSPTTASRPVPPTKEAAAAAASSNVDTSNEMTIRESPIRNGAPLGEVDLGLPITPDNDLNTIKPPKIQSASVDPGQLRLQRVTRRTQDWTFPSMPPAPTSHPNSQASKTTNSSVSPSSRPSRSRSSSSTFSIGGMDVAISPMSQIDDPLLSRRAHRADGFTMSSRISLIDLDASLVSLTPPDITITAMANEFPLASRNNHTETFPAFSSPPTNGTSLAPLQSSPCLASFPFSQRDNEPSSSALMLRSPTSPNSIGHNYNYYQTNDFQPSPLLPSPPNENGPSPLRSTHVHHRRKDSGYYASSSSVSSSISRERTRTNSSSQSLPSSCCATPLHDSHSCSGRCQCPTIDETLALDETPPRHRVHYAGQQGAGFRRPVLQREPSLYLPCREEEDEDDKQQKSGYEGSTLGKTDPGHRGLYLPRIILGSRTSSDESVENPYFNRNASMESPTTGGKSYEGHGHDNKGTARPQFGGLGDRTGMGNGGGGRDNFGRRLRPAPKLPEPPKPSAMMGTASQEELRNEMKRLLDSMANHLQFASDVMMGLPALAPPRMPPVVNNNGNGNGKARGNGRGPAGPNPGASGGSNMSLNREASG